VLFRSSYRVRIALELKNLPYEIHHIDLLKAEQKSAEYAAKNPQALVPYLVDGETSIGQSLAIIEYLDEQYPEPDLIYGDAERRAKIRQLSLIIACEVAPLNIPKVFKAYLGGKLGADEAEQNEWYFHWLTEGLNAYEGVLKARNSRQTGRFSCGDAPSMADACLIPQLYNARRFGFDLNPYPLISKIEKQCMAIDAFQRAAPESHKAAPDGLEVIHGPNAPLLNCAA